ncbi:hypothetical protein HKD37_01G000110 [Glycine soja]
MRLHSNLESVDEQETATFAKWILDIGDGIIDDENDGYATIQIPAHLLITQYDDPISNYIITYLIDTCSVKNITTEIVILQIIGDHIEYLSSDSVDKSETNEDLYFQSITTEFLNSLNTSGLPTHSIKLKSWKSYNVVKEPRPKSRLVVTKTTKHVIAAEIISGKNIGLAVYIPRMSMSPSQSPWPFKLLRRQFSIMLSYAMTINKSQGQSLSMVGLYLPKPIITQGQLYVALSRKFIEIPLFYHEQWAPNYPHEVQFKYNGATYPIRVQQHRGRYFFADGLTDVRADLKIYESIIMNFFACDDNTILYLHFTPPLNQQTCGRQILHSRLHTWTTKITQYILGAPQPLVICNHIN